MSRNVDWDDPTEADFRWAVEWERWHELQQAGYDPHEVRERFGLQPHPDGGKFYNTDGVPGDNHPMRVNPETGRIETVLSGGGGQDPDETGDSDEVEPYTEWSNDDLKEELKVRGLATSGKKEDLVHRLEIDDSSRNPED